MELPDQPGQPGQRDQPLFNAAQVAPKSNPWKIPLIILGCGAGLLIGLSLLAILLAVALPMYSTFKQRSKVGMALKVADETRGVLEDWHDREGNFNGIVWEEPGVLTSPEGAMMRFTQIEGVSWSVESEGNMINIFFEWAEGSGCVPANCNGVWQLNCEQGDCIVSIVVGDDDPLGFNTAP